MSAGDIPFDEAFEALTGFQPMTWQRRLYEDWLAKGDIPAACDIPTGLGKTSVITLWYLARKTGARLPRRLAYVVDRRVVVDQATVEAEKIKTKSGDPQLCVSTLRGQHIDNRDWLADPAATAIIVATVDMMGSRLLFSGYGVYPKMRPYHAGLLGADTLVVLDEAHLVPPFENLLEAIECGTEALGPLMEEDRQIVPPFRLLSLSATGRERQGNVFRLRDDDLQDKEVRKRLSAKKTVQLVDVGEKKLEEALAEQAWLLTNKGTLGIRSLVYCDSREIAKKVETGLRAFTKGDKKQGIAEIQIETELFMGARRAKERADAMQRLRELGFIAGDSVPRMTPAFLIATSAGEVGVDLDADHMVCDLVPWERMVQRLGRVNRRGARDARVIIIRESKPEPKKPDQPTPKEKRDAIAYRALNVIAELPKDGTDASPGALRELKLRAEHDDNLRAYIKGATTPTPLRPALTRALIDAWSMTSLEKHTGRPEIIPWLRGWVDEDAPQTSVVWREHLPVRIGGSVLKKDIEDFFEAAPPHMSEQLDTETWRVVEWLMERAETALKQAPSRHDGTHETNVAATDEPEFEKEESRLLKPLTRNHIAAFVLTPRRELHKSYRLSDLSQVKDRKKLKEQLEDDLQSATLVIDFRLGGLMSGALAGTCNDIPRTADDGDTWIEIDGCSVVGFGIRACRSDDLPKATVKGWRESFRFDIERSEDGDAIRWLVVDGANEERRAESRHPQLLDQHQSCAAAKAKLIAEGVGLKNTHANILGLAARLHDEGKRSLRWQRAFNAPRSGLYAKTKGPLKQALLDGYRHEFGSLPSAIGDSEFQDLQTEDPDLAELVLHLIASHHGGARPIISTRSCEDAPPSALEERARDVTLRFARLQKRWGPWGLAWWEALLRAADQQASRENDETGKDDG